MPNFSPDLNAKLAEALENTRRFAEGTPKKEIKEAVNSKSSSHTHPVKPIVKKIKDYLREVNERIMRAKGKILSVF